MARKIKLVHQGTQAAGIDASSGSDQTGTDFDDETHKTNQF
jgi:hypothetical protein